MSKYAKEKTREHMELVRRALIQNPDMSVPQVKASVEAFLKLTKPLDYHYVIRLVKRIHAERANRYAYGNRKRVSELEDHYKFFAMQVRKILQEEELDAKDKISALKTLYDSDVKLFEQQQNANIFPKAPEKVELTLKHTVDDIAPFSVEHMFKVLRGMLEAQVITPVMLTALAYKFESDKSGNNGDGNIKSLPDNNKNE